MYILQASSGFDVKQLLMGSENWEFLLETAIRTSIMFLIIITALRILGKRGVKQLSVFELVVIIGLGSAAGDPMFYKDVGILPALVVFTLIISIYTLITYLVGKNAKFEKLLEGSPVCLLKDGVFSIQNFKKEALGENEFFAELRMAGVSQLGQVEEAIVEISGSISIFYFNDNEVKYGLPIMPDSLKDKTISIATAGYYSCTFCGYTQKLAPTNLYTCPTCQKNHWVPASNKLRIT